MSMANNYSKIATMAQENNPAAIIEALLNELARSCSVAATASGNGDHELRRAMASKAVRIISDGLVPCLDMEKGGEIAANLEAVYDYSIREIVTANKNADADGFVRCRKIILPILEAWRIAAMDARPAPDGVAK